MYTTKLGSSEVLSTLTELQCMKDALTSCFKHSKVSLEVRALIERRARAKFMFEKLCGLPESTETCQELLRRSVMVSGTLRRRETSPYRYLHQSMENLANKQFLEHQSPIERHMNQFGCTRQEAKDATFGERYGLINFNQERIKLSGKQSQYANLDFSNLERRASVFWIDDI